MQQRYRLRASDDFQRLRREGQAVHHRWMTLSVAHNGFDYNRYGFITGKTLGKAVIRNRVRRLLREAVRSVHPRIQPGHDIVIIARRPIVGQPFADIQRIVSEQLRQAGIVVESKAL